MNDEEAQFNVKVQLKPEASIWSEPRSTNPRSPGSNVRCATTDKIQMQTLVEIKSIKAERLLSNFYKKKMNCKMPTFLT